MSLWQVRGAFDALHAASDLAGAAAGEPAGLARATLGAAALHMELGHVGEGGRWASEAMRLAQYMGDGAGATGAMLLLAAVAMRARDAAAAVELLGRVRARARAAGLWRVHATACVALAEAERLAVRPCPPPLPPYPVLTSAFRDVAHTARAQAGGGGGGGGAPEVDGGMHIRVVPRWLALDLGAAAGPAGAGAAASGAMTVPLRERQLHSARMHGVRARAFDDGGEPVLAQIASSVGVRGARWRSMCAAAHQLPRGAARSCADSPSRGRRAPPPRSPSPRRAHCQLRPTATACAARPARPRARCSAFWTPLGRRRGMRTGRRP